jgi:RNA polymerase-binding transcription factor DksA
MTRAELEGYRQQLRALWRRIGQDRSQLSEEARQGTGGEASGGLSDVPTHLADLGSREAEEELTLDLLHNEEQILAEIQDALARIEQGTFGVCEGCHGAIPRERLLVLPYARRCVACADRARPAP